MGDRLFQTQQKEHKVKRKKFTIKSEKKERNRENDGKRRNKIKKRTKNKILNGGFF